MSTIDLAIRAKYVLDQCIKYEKKIALSILVEKTININKLTQLLPKGSLYEKNI